MYTRLLVSILSSLSLLTLFPAEAGALTLSGASTGNTGSVAVASSDPANKDPYALQAPGTPRNVLVTPPIKNVLTTQPSGPELKAPAITNQLTVPTGGQQLMPYTGYNSITGYYGGSELTAEGIHNELRNRGGGTELTTTYRGPQLTPTTRGPQLTTQVRGPQLTAPPAGNPLVSPPIGNTLVSPPIGNTLVSPPIGNTLHTPAGGPTLVSPPMGPTLQSPPIGNTLHTPAGGPTLISPPIGTTLTAPPIGTTLVSPVIGTTLQSPPIGHILVTSHDGTPLVGSDHVDGIVGYQGQGQIQSLGTEIINCRVGEPLWDGICPGVAGKLVSEISTETTQLSSVGECYPSGMRYICRLYTNVTVDTSSLYLCRSLNNPSTCESIHELSGLFYDPNLYNSYDQTLTNQYPSILPPPANYQSNLSTPDSYGSMIQGPVVDPDKILYPVDRTPDGHYQNGFDTAWGLGLFGFTFVGSLIWGNY